MRALVKFALIVCATSVANGHNLGPADVIFHLFSRSNPTQSQPLLPNGDSIMDSTFDIHTRTIITIHSYGESVGGNFNAFVIPEHLAAEDVNVIAVDWSSGSSMYSEGLGNAPQAGEIIANFCNILIVEFLYPAEMFRIVGVGLGGHIAGIAARNMNGVVPHIVALDPSLVGWTHHPDKLNPDDAAVVEVLHTTSGLYGYDYPLGDIDFYPNGGRSQAICGIDIRCSHMYSYIFYAESISAEVGNNDAFVGTACEDYDHAIAMDCHGDRDAVFGGYTDKTYASGIYYFITNMVPPFARG